MYVSNESPTDVFFDNLQVIHTRGAILEETHYYPFGLTMAGISSKAIGKLENRYKFNDGTELENKEFNDGSGLEWYATEFRSYDPQIGRFWQIDELSELTEDWSPYVFALNNPVLLNDPFGLLADTTVDEVPEMAPVIVTPSNNRTPYSPEIVPTTDHSEPNTSKILPMGWISISGVQDLPPGTTASLIRILGITDDVLPEPEAKLAYITWQIENTVVKKTSGWSWRGPMFLGWNVFGNPVYKRFYSGMPPDIGAGGSRGLISIGSKFGKLGKVISNPGENISLFQTWNST